MAADRAQLAQLEERLRGYEAAVFQHPPASWEEFQRRLGGWQELSGLIDDTRQRIEEEDSE